MKTFWKFILILWALTYSPDSPERVNRSQFCDSCIGMHTKITQTCDVCAAAKDSSNT